MKACVFVDGENFRHSIVKLYTQFHQEDYLPKSADWTKLFEWIVTSAIGSGDRLRTYWYVIKTLDFYPSHFPSALKEPAKLQSLLSQHEPYKKELDALVEPQLSARMNAMVSDLQAWQNVMTQRFNTWTAIQDEIAEHYRSIEFRRAGAMTCNSFERQLGREKAVDVKLATDMITLCDIYDVAIIVSGDQDYVPAVEVIKDYGKQVVSVAFKTRGGQLLPGGARRLNQSTDWSLELLYQPLGEHLHILPPTIPIVRTAVVPTPPVSPRIP